MKKINLIFGGNKGIGHEILKIFKNKKVVTVSRSISKKKNHIQCDLLNENDIKSKINKLKKTKIQNIIFVQRYRGLNEIEEYRLMILSPLIILKILANNIVKNGSIIFIGSTCTSKLANDQNANYHAIRYGLIGLVKFFAYSLGKKNKITVNLVSTSKILKKENLVFFKKSKFGKN